MTQELDDLQVMLQHYWKLYSGRIVAGAVLLVLLWASGSTLYKVEADSRAVVLRLGKKLKIAPPGLHLKLPWPIDTAYSVPVERVQSIEFGYRTLVAGRRTEYARPGAQDKMIARMLTADLNLAHVEWVVQYQIIDPELFLFRVGGDRRSDPNTNARDLIADVSEAAMRRIIGDVSVDSVITIGREQIAQDAKIEMQQMLDGFESGVRVVNVRLQSATPPDKVKDAFDAVNRAKQSKERVVNESKGERNRLIPAARGRRDRTIAEAEGYALRVQKEATGQGTAFLAQLAEYEKAPEITRMRLYLEGMEDILMKVVDKTVIDESITGTLPLLHLNPSDASLSTGGSRQRGRLGGGQ